ncbi:MAG TPA: hypothetical protein VFA57_20080 [Pseudolabrys sp.]|jgi:hypothetical protein|nr:hypothetical protein [Pseudolabrys sp.]
MGIAHRIELYNQASRLARDHIANDPELKGRAGLIKHLHEAIRHEIASGVTEPVTVAANAIRRLQAERLKNTAGGAV